ncbi:hypothetical protein NFJ02_22g50320 [Pycnococcus provasolii]
MESTLQTQQGARVFRLHSTSSNTTSAISQGSSYTATNLAKQDSKVPHGIAVTMPGALLVCDVRAAIAPSELIGIKQTATSATPSTTTTAPSPSPSPSVTIIITIVIHALRSAFVEVSQRSLRLCGKSCRRRRHETTKRHTNAVE